MINNDSPDSSCYCCVKDMNNHIELAMLKSFVPRTFNMANLLCLQKKIDPSYLL